MPLLLVRYWFCSKFRLLKSKVLLIDKIKAKNQTLLRCDGLTSYHSDEQCCHDMIPQSLQSAFFTAMCIPPRKGKSSRGKRCTQTPFVAIIFLLLPPKYYTSMAFYTFLHSCTISSSAKTWSLPHRCGWCLADLPQTQACEKDWIKFLCKRLQNSSMVGFSACKMTGSS